MLLFLNEMASKRFFKISLRPFQFVSQRTTTQFCWGYGRSIHQTALIWKKNRDEIGGKNWLNWVIWGLPPSQEMGSVISTLMVQENSMEWDELMKDLFEMWQAHHLFNEEFFHLFLKGFCSSLPNIKLVKSGLNQHSHELSILSTEQHMVVAKLMEKYWSSFQKDPKDFSQFLANFFSKDIPEIADQKEKAGSENIDFSFDGFIIQIAGKVISDYSKQGKIYDEDIGDISSTVLNSLLISERTRRRHQTPEDDWEVNLVSNMISSIAHFHRNEGDPHDRHLVEHLLRVNGSGWTIYQFEDAISRIKTQVRDPTTFKGRLKSLFGAFGIK